MFNISEDYHNFVFNEIIIEKMFIKIILIYYF
jgi:hypothetical protein